MIVRSELLDKGSVDQLQKAEESILLCFLSHTSLTHIQLHSLYPAITTLVLNQTFLSNLDLHDSFLEIRDWTSIPQAYQYFM